MKKIAVKFLDAFIVLYLVIVSSASASESEEKAFSHALSTTSEGIGNTGVEMLLVVLGAVTGLIVLVLILPKAIGFIKKFI